MVAFTPCFSSQNLTVQVNWRLAGASDHLGHTARQEEYTDAILMLKVRLNATTMADGGAGEKSYAPEVKI
eukprot:1195127-Prorocentrum_minimum.AAC.2